MFLFLIILGLLPSIVWLLYYLREDVHPEPKRMILKVFLWGALITLVAAAIESGFNFFFSQQIPNEIISSLFFIFIGVALTEEFLKYFVVRINVLKSPEFDEPVDAMIYMVVAALGFAAAENILLLVSPQITNFFAASFPQIQPVEVFNFNQALSVILIRFWGATFLHVLASAILGFFLAFSFYHHGEFKLPMMIAGLGLATLLHGFFNYFIIQIETDPVFVLYIILLLISSALLVAFFFRRLKSKRVIKEISI